MQRDLLRLGHMLDASEAIVGSIEGVTVDQLRSDDVLLEALLWRFTKLGEAAYHVSAELKAKYPDFEWDGAMATRNRVVHGYFDIDVSIVHTAASTSVPRLVEHVKRILQAEFPDHSVE